MTKKLYQIDVYQKECSSTILEMRGEGTQDSPWMLVLNETVFFPTGGGQPCDLGTIDGIPVTDVFEKDETIFHQLQPLDHTLNKSGTAGGPDRTATEKQYPALKPGGRVTCRIDWERRFGHMQRHCGEHILSGIFFRECGGVNRGFHMGKDSMTIDIDAAGITMEDALRAEALTNEVIWADVPVTTRYFTNRSEAESLPLRKPLAIDEDISIVCVGDESNPADCVACCGTHPCTSGQVGLVKILKLESYKGMTRIYFKAGKEALLDYQNKHRILTELNQKYSSEDSDLLMKIKAQDEKNKEARQELHLLKNTLLTRDMEEILSSYERRDSQEQEEWKGFTSSQLTVREFSYFRANELMTMSRALTEKLKCLLLLVSSVENTVILASSGSHDCGKLVKDNANVWNGKGGGNAGSARVMFPSREALDCFITFVRQAYGQERP